MGEGPISEECEELLNMLDQYPPQPPNLLFVLSGPSGVGKDTVIGRLKEGIDLHFAVTVTTRARRPNEVHGVNYYFVSQEEFVTLQREDALLEWAVVHGNYYGTPAQQIRDALRSGKDVLLKIDVQGAAEVKRRVSDAVFIFLAPPSIEDLTQRLTGRATESLEEQAKRLCDARREIKHLTEYDYVVVNRRIEEAVAAIKAIITAERARVHPRRIEL